MENVFKRTWIFYILYSNQESERKEMIHEMPVSYRVGLGSVIDYIIEQDRMAITINCLNVPIR